MKPARFPTRSPLGVLRAMSEHPVNFLVRADALGEPVVRSWLGPFPQWFVFDAELGRDVLQRLDDDFNRPPYLRHLIGAVTGKSLFTSIGDEWGQRRRMLQPEFHRSRVQNLTGDMRDVIDAELSKWPIGHVFDAQAAVASLALRVAGRTMFGVDLMDAERGVLAESFATMSDWLTIRFYDPKALPAPIPTRANRRFHAARQTLREFVRCLIKERRARPSGAYDVLQILLDARLDSGDRLSEDDLIAESLGFLFAGHETTASALTWALFELAHHPSIAETVRGEGAEGDTLRRVLRETLRLHPPAWGIPRTASRSTMLGPYPVHRGVGVIVSTYTINRNPRYWDRPDTYDPDRYLAGRDEGRPAYLPLAFGGGPHMCIGQAFAELEAHLVLGEILDRFDLAALDRDPAFMPRFSLHMTEGLPLTLGRRAPARA
jgi:cytochrome P450